MSSTTPTVKQVAWISLIPQLIFMALLCVMYHYVFKLENSILWGALTYLAISFSLRGIITKEQKKGMSCIKNGDYNGAIEHFQKTYDFFTRNEWVDRYRYLTLLSSSRINYREMALNNIAFSYGQLGDIGKSKEFYEKTLQEFPDSALAKTALSFLNGAVEDKDAIAGV